MLPALSGSASYSGKRERTRSYQRGRKAYVSIYLARRDCARDSIGSRCPSKCCLIVDKQAYAQSHLGPDESSGSSQSGKARQVDDANVACGEGRMGSKDQTTDTKGTKEVQVKGDSLPLGCIS